MTISTPLIHMCLNYVHCALRSAGEPHHATWFQYDRLGLRRMAAGSHLDGTHGAMQVADASDTVYTRPEDYRFTE